MSEFQSPDLAIISMLSGEPVEVLEESPAALTLGQLLIRDGLTGLYNYQYFQQRLALVMESAAAAGVPVSLLVVDLNGLKHVNDSLGHAAGNRLIEVVGRTLAAQTPENGFTARYGGDEFVVALPEYPEPAALAMARRLQDALGQVEVRLPEGVTLTGVRASIGVATGTAGSMDHAALFAAADQAMYYAKRRTKDGICLYSAISRKKPSARTAVDTLRPTPPSGVLALLCCRYRGIPASSTSEWDVAEQMALVASGLQRSGGVLFRQGANRDQLCAAFSEPAEAVTALVGLYQNHPAIVRQDLPFGGIQIALHVGMAEFDGEAYTGEEVRHCSRIAELASAGQILLSANAAARLQTALPEGSSLYDLGWHRLRDLHSRERLYQLLHPAWSTDPGPARSLDAFAHNLPAQPTSFVGREEELAAVRGLLNRVRLLTLTGPGGTGKTRLALQAAAEMLEAFPDGVWLVELAALTDPDQVPHALAAATGLRSHSEGSLLEALIDHLTGRQVLLVLDNCEHLAQACAALVTTLLNRCPELRVLATSREVLGVPGETVWTVLGMAVPDPTQTMLVEHLVRYDAVQLFLERARLQQPDFTLTRENAPTVLRICQRLDGIALALELAAAMVKVLSVEEIAARLDQRFHLLMSGSATVLPRHQTLRALIDWSHDLLTEKERRIWYRLSVFVGTFSLRAAEEICGTDGIEAGEVLALLSGLVRKSLIIREQRGETRYRWLETLRAYALEKLQSSGEAEVFFRLHRDWYVSLIEQVEFTTLGPEQAAWVARMDAEQENLWAALRWSRQRDDVEAELRLVRGLVYFWGYRQSPAGQEWLDRLLTLPGIQSDAVLRGRILQIAGVLAYMRGHCDAAVAYYRESLSLRRELGDTLGAARMLWNLAVLAEFRGDWDQAFALFLESAEIGQPHGYRPPHIRLGIHELATSRLDGQQVLPRLDRLLHEIEEMKEPIHHAHACWYAAEVACSRGETAWAAARLQAALETYRALGFRSKIALALADLANVLRIQGELHRAAELFRQALMLYQEIGGRLKEGEAECLEGVAALTHLRGDPATAARLLGAAAHLREVYGVPLRPLRQARYEAEVAAVRAVMEPEAFATASSEGRAMTLPRALEYALGEALAVVASAHADR